MTFEIQNFQIFSKIKTIFHKKFLSSPKIDFLFKVFFKQTKLKWLTNVLNHPHTKYLTYYELKKKSIFLLIKHHPHIKRRTRETNWKFQSRPVSKILFTWPFIKWVMIASKNNNNKLNNYLLNFSWKKNWMEILVEYILWTVDIGA